MSQHGWCYLPEVIIMETSTLSEFQRLTTLPNWQCTCRFRRCVAVPWRQLKEKWEAGRRLFASDNGRTGIATKIGHIL